MKQELLASGHLDINFQQSGLNFGNNGNPMIPNNDCGLNMMDHLTDATLQAATNTATGNVTGAVVGSNAASAAAVYASTNAATPAASPSWVH